MCDPDKKGPGFTPVGYEWGDTIIGGDTNQFSDGRGGDDFIDLGGGDDVLRGGTGNDHLLGGTGNDQLDGDADHDTLEGGAGVDVLFGGDGDDRLYGEHMESEADGASDELHGGAGSDQIFGGGGADTLGGDDGDDALEGGSGNDLLHGGTGGDTLRGGTGDDYYVVDDTRDVVVEVSGEGLDTVQSSINFTLSDNIENLVLDPSLLSINGTGNALDNVIRGNAGNNRLDGKAGADTMTGESGNDTYFVDNPLDRVVEQAGGGTDTVEVTLNYTLSTNVEHLLLSASANALRGSGNELNNLIVGNGHGNTLHGLDGADNLLGAGGDDALFGGIGDDRLNGDDGNDFLDGGAGQNSMVGGSGDDTYVVEDNGDTLTEANGQGTDTVRSSIAYALGTNVEHLVLTEPAGSVNGMGNGLANVLTGNGHVNLLSGGDGNDVLDGGAGADTLVGGAGDDVLVFDAADLAIAGGRWFGQAGLDSVRMGQGQSLDLVALSDDAMTGVDVIDLSAIGGNGVTIAATDIRAMSDAATLRITGDRADNVAALGNWSESGDVLIGAQLYHSLSADGVSLLIDTDIGLTFLQPGG